MSSFTGAQIRYKPGKQIPPAGLLARHVRLPVKAVEEHIGASKKNTSLPPQRGIDATYESAKFRKLYRGEDTREPDVSGCKKGCNFALKVFCLAMMTMSLLLAYIFNLINH
jgi:hypothetical protein